jgi:hypothetical protein
MSLVTTASAMACVRELLSSSSPIGHHACLSAYWAHAIHVLHTAQREPSVYQRDLRWQTTLARHAEMMPFTLFLRRSCDHN